MRISEELGFTYLLISETDINKWCEKYDLHVFFGDCSKCEAKLEVNIPFIAKDMRGLKADICKCGNKEVPFSYINTNFNEINLNSLIGGENV